MTTRKKKTTLIERLLALMGAGGIALLVWVGLFAAVDWIAMPLYTGHNRDAYAPNLLGRDFQGALSLAKNTGFDIHSDIIKRSDANHPAGVVIEQYPAGGSLCKKGRKIKITVSSGEELSTIPEVIGLSEKEASMRIKAAGFTINDDSIKYIYSNYYPEGVVTEQSLQAGLKASRGCEAGLTISMGSPPSNPVIPDVRNKTLTEARRAIFKAGMKLGIVEYVEYPRAEIGEVLWQNPLPGDRAEPGTEINIRVNQAKPTAEVVAIDSTETPTEAPQE